MTSEAASRLIGRLRLIWPVTRPLRTADQIAEVSHQFAQALPIRVVQDPCERLSCRNETPRRKEWPGWEPHVPGTRRHAAIRRPIKADRLPVIFDFHRPTH
jgi:hypothetical protein